MFAARAGVREAPPAEVVIGRIVRLERLERPPPLAGDVEVEMGVGVVEVDGSIIGLG